MHAFTFTRGHGQRRMALLLLCALLTTGLVAPVPARAQEVPPTEVPDLAPPTSDVRRISGPDRIETAVALSVQHWPTSEHAVLVRADDFPDALAAGPLAAKLDAPVLLTERDALAPAVAAELQRLGTTTVWIIGGGDAVAVDVSNEVLAAGLAVNRLQGVDRFATAAAVAAEVGDSSEIILALGAHHDPARAWADAVSSGAFAATTARPPLLLSTLDGLPAATEEALAQRDRGATRVWIAGGPAAIPETVETRLGELGFAATRLAGDNRYATSAAIAQEVRARLSPVPRPLVVASGAAFPDALAAAPVAARTGGVLVLVPPADLNAPPDAGMWINQNVDGFAHAVVAGGPAAVSEQVAQQIAALLETRTVPVDDGFNSSQEAIAAALAAGTIDYPMSLHHRALALYGDPALPAEFQGDGAEWEELGDLLSEIRAALPGLDAAGRAMLEPFALRPAASGSYFNPNGAAVAGNDGGTFLQAEETTPAGRVCTAGWDRKPAEEVPAWVWMCMDDPDHATSIQAALKIVDEYWPKEIKLMGQPIRDGDAVAGKRGDENPDDKIDLYLVGLGDNEIRYTVTDLQYVGGALRTHHDRVFSSGFLVIDKALVAENAYLLTRGIVHEFFHVLQFAHGRDCANEWVSEASARWADLHFVPEGAGPTFQMEFVDGRLATPERVIDGMGFQERPPGRSLPVGNHYRSFIWFYYLVQQKGGSPQVVADTWNAIKAKGTCDYNAAVNSVTPFAEHFKGFALRNLNKDLQPGSPIKPLYNDTAKHGHADFPVDKPPILHRDETIELGSRLSLTSLPYLGSKYYRYKAEQAARAVELDFTSIGKSIDVMVLYKANGTWQPVSEVTGKLRLCRDDPEEKFDGELYIVVANHTTTDVSTGSHKLTGIDDCSKTAGGGVTQTHSHDGTTEDGIRHHGEDTLKLDVKLINISLDPDDPQWVDDGTSTWSFAGSSRVEEQCGAKLTYSGSGTSEHMSLGLAILPGGSEAIFAAVITGPVHVKGTSGSIDWPTCNVVDRTEEQLRFISHCGLDGAPNSRERGNGEVRDKEGGGREVVFNTQCSWETVVQGGIVLQTATTTGSFDLM